MGEVSTVENLVPINRSNRQATQGFQGCIVMLQMCLQLLKLMEDACLVVATHITALSKYDNRVSRLYGGQGSESRL